VPYLVLVIQCDNPPAPSARYELVDLQSAAIGRGEREMVESSRTPPASLRLDIPDPKVSQKHATLKSVGGRWVLEDAGSTNGTILNGSKVDRAVLNDGDVFEVGYTFFLYRLSHPQSGRPAAAVDDAAIERSEPGISTFSPTLSGDFEALVQLVHAPISFLIEGETGTGKELVARAIHALSGRTGPFVAINCGAVPESLIESELFGYRKGAFSGAFQDRVGLIREADKGTLFLDEIGELPLTSQVKLLRVLQEREVLPLGVARPVPVDIKVCAATHRRLEDLVEEKRFREDLLGRVSGFQLHLPPLRNRREDLGLLIRTILLRLSPERASSVRFTRAAVAALFQYHWPLNIRELEMCLAAALTLSKQNLIGIEHLPEKVRSATQLIPAPGELPAIFDDPEASSQLREKLTALLMSHNGNVSALARSLGRDRVQVRRWLRKFNLDPARFKAF
jgi:DNA-binding NtrC family response regulator